MLNWLGLSETPEQKIKRLTEKGSLTALKDHLKTLNPSEFRDRILCIEALKHAVGRPSHMEALLQKLRSSTSSAYLLIRLYQLRKDQRLSAKITTQLNQAYQACLDWQCDTLQQSIAKIGYDKALATYQERNKVTAHLVFTHLLCRVVQISTQPSEIRFILKQMQITLGEKGIYLDALGSALCLAKKRAIRTMLLTQMQPFQSSEPKNYVQWVQNAATTFPSCETIKQTLIAYKLFEIQQTLEATEAAHDYDTLSSLLKALETIPNLPEYHQRKLKALRQLVLLAAKGRFLKLVKTSLRLLQAYHLEAIQYIDWIRTCQKEALAAFDENSHPTPTVAPTVACLEHAIKAAKEDAVSFAYTSLTELINGIVSDDFQACYRLLRQPVAQTVPAIKPDAASLAVINLLKMDPRASTFAKRSEHAISKIKALSTQPTWTVGALEALKQTELSKRHEMLKNHIKNRIEHGLKKPNLEGTYEAQVFLQALNREERREILVCAQNHLVQSFGDATPSPSKVYPTLQMICAYGLTTDEQTRQISIDAMASVDLQTCLDTLYVSQHQLIEGEVSTLQATLENTNTSNLKSVLKTYQTQHPHLFIAISSHMLESLCQQGPFSAIIPMLSLLPPVQQKHCIPVAIASLQKHAKKQATDVLAQLDLKTNIITYLASSDEQERQQIFAKIKIQEAFFSIDLFQPLGNLLDQVHGCQLLRLILPHIQAKLCEQTCIALINKAWQQQQTGLHQNILEYFQTQRPHAYGASLAQQLIAEPKSLTQDAAMARLDALASLTNPAIIATFWAQIHHANKNVCLDITEAIIKHYETGAPLQKDFYDHATKVLEDAPPCASDRPFTQHIKALLHLLEAVKDNTRKSVLLWEALSPHAMLYPVLFAKTIQNILSHLPTSSQKDPQYPQGNLRQTLKRTKDALINQVLIKLKANVAITLESLQQQYPNFYLELIDALLHSPDTEQHLAQITSILTDLGNTDRKTLANMQWQHSPPQAQKALQEIYPKPKAHATYIKNTLSTNLPINPKHLPCLLENLKATTNPSNCITTLAHSTIHDPRIDQTLMQIAKEHITQLPSAFSALYDSISGASSIPIQRRVKALTTFLQDHWQNILEQPTEDTKQEVSSFIRSCPKGYLAILTPLLPKVSPDMQDMILGCFSKTDREKLLAQWLLDPNVNTMLLNKLKTDPICHAKGIRWALHTWCQPRHRRIDAIAKGLLQTLIHLWQDDDRKKLIEYLLGFLGKSQVSDALALFIHNEILQLAKKEPALYPLVVPGAQTDRQTLIQNETRRQTILKDMLNVWVGHCNLKALNKAALEDLKTKHRSHWVELFEASAKQLLDESTFIDTNTTTAKRLITHLPKEARLKWLDALLIDPMCTTPKGIKTFEALAPTDTTTLLDALKRALSRYRSDSKVPILWLLDTAKEVTQENSEDYFQMLLTSWNMCYEKLHAKLAIFNRNHPNTLNITFNLKTANPFNNINLVQDLSSLKLEENTTEITHTLANIERKWLAFSNDLGEAFAPLLAKIYKGHSCIKTTHLLSKWMEQLTNDWDGTTLPKWLKTYRQTQPNLFCHIFSFLLKRSFQQSDDEGADTYVSYLDDSECVEILASVIRRSSSEENFKNHLIEKFSKGQLGAILHAASPIYFDALAHNLLSGTLITNQIEKHLSDLQDCRQEAFVEAFVVVLAQYKLTSSKTHIPKAISDCIKTLNSDEKKFFERCLELLKVEENPKNLDARNLVLTKISMGLNLAMQ